MDLSELRRCHAEIASTNYYLGSLMTSYPDNFGEEEIARYEALMNHLSELEALFAKLCTEIEEFSI